MKKILLPLLFALMALPSVTGAITYPYAVHYLALNIEGQPVRMAYMDAGQAKAADKVVLLFHGKNFSGFYWKSVIDFLVADGYRVIAPDQVGWGLSDKPNIHYSFHMLAANTRALLDTLGIGRIHVIAHSMGGMLATRFALMYPATVKDIIYENPIGLEDYKTFVPYRSVDEEYATELRADYESLKKYQQSYYPQWKPEYEPYVAAQYDALQIPNFQQATWASALTYEMIYEQPVVYEFRNITQPTLLLIGQADRTVVGKNLLNGDSAAKHGNYPQLGKMLHGWIRNSKLVELPGVGHIPHIQTPDRFREEVLAFLRK